MKPIAPDPALIVTDHAVLRYIERVYGVDIDSVRAELAAIVAPAIAVGANSVSRGGYTYMIRDGRVTTVTHGASPLAVRRNAPGAGVTRPIRDVRA